MTSEARFPLRIDWERVQALPEWQRGGSLAALEPPLVCFPLRSEWVALQPKVAQTFPEPLRTSEEAAPIQPPSAVLKMAQRGTQAAWSVNLTYAEGFWPHASYGTPGKTPKVSWVVRMTRGSHRAVAVYVEGSWRSLWDWSADQFFRRSPRVADFEGVLSEQA